MHLPLVEDAFHLVIMDVYIVMTPLISVLPVKLALSLTVRKNVPVQTELIPHQSLLNACPVIQNAKHVLVPQKQIAQAVPLSIQPAHISTRPPTNANQAVDFIFLKTQQFLNVSDATLTVRIVEHHHNAQNAIQSIISEN